MTPDLLLTLLPLAIGAALVPIPVLVTALLLRSPSGRGPAVGWVGGLVTVRVAQGALLAMLLGGVIASEGEKGPIASVALIVLALVFLVSAARKALDAPDEDAPPPRWMATLSALTPGKAFVFGFGLLAIGVKHWVFTLGAVGAISEAAPAIGMTAAVVAFLLFVLVAHAPQLGLLLLAFVAPARADALLGRFERFLAKHSRPLLAGVSLVFGIWFLLKGLDGLGVI